MEELLVVEFMFKKFDHPMSSGRQIRSYDHQNWLLIRITRFPVWTSILVNPVYFAYLLILYAI